MKSTLSPLAIEKHQDLFLRNFVVTGTIARACARAGITRDRYLQWLERDPNFAKKVEEAKIEHEKRLIESYENEADRRAIDGVDEPIYWQGQQVGTKKRFSDNLLMFRLKGMSPEKYADRGYLDTRNANLNIQEVNVSEMTPEDAERYVRQLLANVEKVKPQVEGVQVPVDKQLMAQNDSEQSGGAEIPSGENNGSQGSVARISDGETAGNSESGQK